MPRKKIEMILAVHRACRKSLFDVLHGITPEQLHWKPAPDSRNIAEMMRHLIRVDMWFLKRQGFEPTVNDIKDPTADQLREMLHDSFGRLEDTLTSFESDDALLREITVTDAVAYKTPATIFMHIPQHYLYHLSQMIYLRRAQDRHWESPLKAWEHATDVIAEHLWKDQ